MPSRHHRTTLSGCIFTTDTCIDIRKKNLLNSSTSSTCPDNMVNFVPLTAEIGSGVCCTPANFIGFSILAALLHGTLVVGVSQTLRHWTEGASYIRQGGHHVGHWRTLVIIAEPESWYCQWKVGCWVNLGTAVWVHSLYPRPYIAVAVMINSFHDVLDPAVKHAVTTTETCKVVVSLVILRQCCPHRAGAPSFPLFPLSIHLLIFTLFLLFPFIFFYSLYFFLLLSIPSLSTRIDPLHFQAGGCRNRPNLDLVCLCLFCVICIS